MIGLVGTVLGDAGVNIADMGLSRSRQPGSALMVIATNGAVPDEVLARLAASPGILSVFSLRS
jgi:D-3-phosphoglycerate dehydrogenase / 2-oxoglutarate reductase